MEIKIADKNEVKELIPIFKEVFEIHNIFTKSDEEIEKYLMNLFEEGKFAVVIEDEVIAGCYFVKEDTWRIKHFGVKEEHQNQGVGRDLLNFVEKEIGQDEIDEKKIIIKVSQNEFGSIEFYERNGYMVIEEMPDYYRDKETVFILQKGG